MAYLQDFYPLDIDDSYTEYVISELWQMWYFIIGRRLNSQKSTMLPLWQVHNMAKITGMAAVFKAFQIKIMAYLQDFYPLDIDDSYIEYAISELKYDDSDILLLDIDSIAKFQTRMALCHLWQVRTSRSKY